MSAQIGPPQPHAQADAISGSITDLGYIGTRNGARTPGHTYIVDTYSNGNLQWVDDDPEESLDKSVDHAEYG